MQGPRISILLRLLAIHEIYEILKFKLLAFCYPFGSRMLERSKKAP